MLPLAARRILLRRNFNRCVPALPLYTKYVCFGDYKKPLDNDKVIGSQGSVKPQDAQRSTFVKGDEAEFDGPQNPNRNTTPEQSSEPYSANSQPLPDLRHGLPSTFESEFRLRPERKDNNGGEATEVDIINQTPKARSGGGGSGGELPKSAYESSQDRWRNRAANYTYAGFAFLGLTSALYLGREWETDEERSRHPNIPSGWSPSSIYSRAKARMTKRIDVFTEPSFPKLLPSLDMAPPYTLVVSLEDLLIHSEWTRDHGWRMAKRPGVDYFLRYLSQYYELVVFTTLPFAAAEPVIRKLDPYRIIMWPLAREATRYEKGEYVKDLSYLNRDLSKVILIDTNPGHAKLQPENSIILQPWRGDPKDRELVSLIPFLEHVASMGIDDTRKAIESFTGKHIPTEFALREAKAREAFQKQLEEEKLKRPRSSGVGLLASSLGIKSPGTVTGEPTAAQGLEKGKMLSDQIRERGQMAYEVLEKEIRENGEKWLKEMEAEEKKMQEETVKSMKSGFTSWFGGNK